MENMENAVQRFNYANQLYAEGKLEAAAEIYMEVEKNANFAPFCYYQLAKISNMAGDPTTAYALYYKAFTKKPDIAKQLFQSSAHQDYVYPGMKVEKETTHCPLCGGKMAPHWCYCMLEAASYDAQFNPVRMWLYCEKCHHMVAQHFPETLDFGNSAMKPQPGLFSIYSEILGKLRPYANGITFLEIGIGAGECILAAREMGYDCYGIDVAEANVKQARERFGLEANACDFLDFEPGRQWDTIVMGDVIEHVDNPVLALEKVAGLLKDDGVLWMSTPNFESCFSQYAQHDDPMRKEAWHLNYFSRESLYTTLGRVGLIPLEYSISRHYNGSMELIVVKKDRA